MSDVLPTLVLWTALLLGLVLLRPSADATERRWIGLAALLQIAAISAFHVVVFGIYSGGDTVEYLSRSAEIREAVASDPRRMVLELFRLLAQQETPLQELVRARGRSTATMTATVTLLRFALADSPYAIGTALGLASFFGRIALYRGLRLAVPEVRPVLVFASCLVVPSVLFWSGGIVKESIAVGGLGLLVLGAARWIERRDVGGIPALVVGALLVLLLKAYFLVPFAAAAGAWAAARRGVIRRGRRVHVRPERLLVGAVVALAGIVLVGTLFPSYAIPNLVEEVATRQELGAVRAGGSTFVTETQVQRGLGSVLLWAPIGLLTALSRPLLFEARSAMLLVSAAEMSLFLLLIARLLLGVGPTAAFRRLLASPGLIFCAVMTLGVALGVGLSTVNLGTLARYRTPMLPFYAVLLFGMGATAAGVRSAPMAGSTVSTRSSSGS